MSIKQDYTKQCPICRSSDLRTVYAFKEFTILKCQDCQNSWRSNMYDEKRIKEIYCIDNYEENPYFSYELDEVDKLANNRFKNYKKALDYLKENNHTGKLLDIGCGSGTFLSMAKKYNWSLVGIEISEELSNLCKKNVPGAEVINERFENIHFKESQFDLITMWDVIEHVIDPIEVITLIKNLLKPNGIAIFCTPDENSFLAKLGKTFYHTGIAYPALALHPPNHTYFFSRTGFKQIAKQLDLTPIKDYSQEAFFEHSEMASKVQKVGITMIEKVGGIFDARYEMVVMMQKNS